MPADRQGVIGPATCVSGTTSSRGASISGISILQGASEQTTPTNTAMKGKRMKIVIIGGTGLIGSQVTEILASKGHDAVSASPSSGVDTVTGAGLAEALSGADVVVDLANSPSFDDGPAMEFFQTSGRNIVGAEIGAGVKHHVALSVVGTDRLQASGYFRAKAAQEQIIRQSTVPYTIVHATQFFEFVRSIAQFSTVGDAVHVPPVLFQPIAAEDVAHAVAEAALASPVNGIVEVAGPDTFTLDKPLREVLVFDGDGRDVVVDDSAKYFGVDVGERALVPTGDARLGKIHFKSWLPLNPVPSKN